MIQKSFITASKKTLSSKVLSIQILIRHLRNMKKRYRLQESLHEAVPRLQITSLPLCMALFGPAAPLSMFPTELMLKFPLQSYFRLNAPGAGQFEHTLIIVGKGAKVHFIEGCSAPKYNVC